MYDPECRVQCEIDAFLNRIFPDAELKNYALNVFSNMMDPVDHKENMIYIWLGGSSTSELLSLLEQACGSHIARVDKEILTSGGYFNSKYNEQAAHRQLLVLEDGSNCQIRLENVKKLLNITSCKPTGDLHIICNAVPRFEFGNNSLVDRRLRIIPFSVHAPGLLNWVNPVWAPYFWWRLVHIYNEGCRRVEVAKWDKSDEELLGELPAVVRTALEHNYPQKNSFECFMDEHLRVVEEPQVTIMDDIVREYRAWMDGQPNPGRRLKKDEMYDALLSRFTLRIEGGVFKNLALV